MLFPICFGWIARRVIKCSIRAGGVRNFWGKVFWMVFPGVVVSGVLVCCFSGDICGDAPASLTMKGNDRKGVSMCCEQEDLNNPRYW